MKTLSCIFTALLLLLSINRLNAQEFNYNKPAKNILKTNLNIQQGDVVMVQAGQHMLNLYAAFNEEAAKLGAALNPSFYTDNMLRAMYKNIPENNIYMFTNIAHKSIEITNVLISLPLIENETEAYKGLEDDELIRAKEANDSANIIIKTSKVINCNIHDVSGKWQIYETPDIETYKEMHWKAVFADYKKISENAGKLRQLFINAENIEITTPRGTDITLSSNGRTCLIKDGIIDDKDKKSENYKDREIYLPAGYFETGVVANTGKGNVFIPKDHIYSSNTIIKNINFKLKNGKISNLKAETGEEELLKSRENIQGVKDMLCAVGIGLNPELKVSGDDVDGRLYKSEGIVCLAFGDNTKAIENNNADYEIKWYFYLTDATIKIDEKVILLNGKLLLD